MSVIKTVKSGRVEIEIREYADGRFGFDFYDESHRRVKCRWKDSEKAITEARDRAKIISGGRVEMLTASKEEWAAFQAFKSSGLSLDELSKFKEWISARSKSRTITEVRDELLAIKESNTGIDPYYTAALAGSWKRFVETFGAQNMAEIEPEEIEAWLLGLKRSARTRNNIRDAVVMLFRFARKRGYLPDSITAAEKIDRIKIRTLAGNIEIYTPGEMRSLLKAAPETLLPWVVIGGFAGIRTEEMRPKEDSRKSPLRWEDFRWDEKQIVLRAETSKTDRTRYIPMPDNLTAWLAGIRRDNGEVFPMRSKSLYDAIGKLRKDTGSRGREKKNALRHSYGSYRNAIIRNIGTLAEEMGNSPGIARKNYERPQPRGIAEEWFAIMP